MYPEEIVIPMKEELTDNGFSELSTAPEVDAQLAKEGTTLLVINSVCGCSAGTARPGVLMAVANAPKKPVKGLTEGDYIEEFDSLVRASSREASPVCADTDTPYFSNMRAKLLNKFNPNSHLLPKFDDPIDRACDYEVREWTDCYKR